MSEVPHHRAAFINAIAEEGTKAEAVEYLQKMWNELCDARSRIRELEGEQSTPAPVSVSEAARVLLGIVERREWSHYPIEMPLTLDGKGPAKVGRDAHCMTYEVWKSDTFRAISDHNNLPDAIEAWLLALIEKDKTNER